MQHILPILMRYRYLILASLSLLLISEMVVVDIDSVPVEYGWIFRCLVALTMVAWTGILCVIGYGPPIDRAVPKRTSNIYAPDSSVIDALEDEPKRRGHTILVLSPALFAMFAFLSILSPILFHLGPILFQAQFLLDLIAPYWTVFFIPYRTVFFMVWIGLVVVVGATVNIDSSKKTYLVVNVFPLLVLVWTMLYIAASSASGCLGVVMYLFGGLVVFLSYFLMIWLVVRRAMLPDKYWIRLAVISFGISVVLSAVSFIPVMLVMQALFEVPILDTCRSDYHGSGIGSIVAIILVVPIVIPILMSLTTSVPLTILIGTMRRPIRNITTVVGSMLPLIMLFVLSWFNIW